MAETTPELCNMEELQLLLAERVMIRSVLSVAETTPELCNMEELQLLLAERVMIRSILSVAEATPELCNMEELQLLLGCVYGGGGCRGREHEQVKSVLSMV